jgi:hypothetical protein
MPVASWSRTPAAVASSGRIAWVAAEVQVAWAARRPGTPATRSAAAAYAAAECSSAARSPGSDVAFRSSACDAGRISRRNVAQRSSAPGAASWSPSTGVTDSVTRPGAASRTSSSGT